MCDNDTNKLFIRAHDPQASLVERKGERPPDVTGQDFPRMFRNKFRGRNTAARTFESLRTSKGKPVVVIPVSSKHHTAESYRLDALEYSFSFRLKSDETEQWQRKKRDNNR